MVCQTYREEPSKEKEASEKKGRGPERICLYEMESGSVVLNTKVHLLSRRVKTMSLFYKMHRNSSKIQIMYEA